MRSSHPKSGPLPENPLSARLSPQRNPPPAYPILHSRDTSRDYPQTRRGIRSLPFHSAERTGPVQCLYASAERVGRTLELPQPQPQSGSTQVRHTAWSPRARSGNRSPALARPMPLRRASLGAEFASRCEATRYRPPVPGCPPAAAPLSSALSTRPARARTPARRARLEMALVNPFSLASGEI